MQLKTTEESEKILNDIYDMYPNLKTELNYETPFQFLVAVMLSAQTTDRQVNLATDKLFKIVKVPKDALLFRPEEFEKYISSLNYYKTKARAIILTAKMLEEDFCGVIPNDLEDMQKLPGVGVKTAKVVLGVLYDAPYIGVDTHVHRVCNRIGICEAKNPEDTDAFLENNISNETKKKVHHSVVLFGRYTCTAKNPKCITCPINQRCNYYFETR